MIYFTKKSLFLSISFILIFTSLQFPFPWVVHGSNSIMAFAYRSQVNIYSNPQYGHTGRILKKLYGGQIISITPVNRSWNRVNAKINGHFGYVHSNDILKNYSIGAYHIYSLRSQTNIYKTPYPYGKRNVVYYSIHGAQSIIVSKMDKNWYKTTVTIKGRNYIGYVNHNDFNFALTPKYNHYYAKRSLSNVYADAYYGDHSIIARIPRGHILYGNSFSGNWNVIRINGRTGFIHNSDFYKNDSFRHDLTIAFGDSVTRGSSADTDNRTTKYSWTNYLPSEIGASRVINYGISGSAVAVRSDRKDSFQERESWINSHGKHPNSIIVLISINDFRHDVPLGNYYVRSRTTFYGGLRNFTEYLQKYNPAAKIIYMLPLSEDAVPTYSTRQKNRLGYTQDDYANAVRSITWNYGIELIDMQHDRYMNTTMNPFNPLVRKEYYIDGLHMNKVGYYLLSKEIARRLLAG